jgi:alkylated DNA repair dioxygenase AlkB
MQQSLLESQPTTFDLPNAELSYYPQFLSNHQDYYQCLLEEITWQQNTLQMFGRSVLIPRLNAWYGDADSHYGYSGIQLEPLPWSSCLLEIKSQVEKLLSAEFNSVLANYYRSGKDSVSWHSDDEPELGPTPLIASVSLGANRRFSLRSRKERVAKVKHIELEGGSLLVMAGSTQQYWHHQISKTAKQVDGRINLTFRTVLNNATGEAV